MILESRGMALVQEVAKDDVSVRTKVGSISKAPITEISDANIQNSRSIFEIARKVVATKSPILLPFTM